MSEDIEKILLRRVYEQVFNSVGKGYENKELL